MLQSIFYARFHPGRGPSIVHEHPPGSVTAPHGPQAPGQKRFLAWSNISAYVIPPYELCNQSLSIATDGHRVLGFPVSLEDPKYERNRFTFNVCFVVPEEADTHLWDQLVRKTAMYFQTLEEEDGLLAAEEALPGLRWAGEQEYPNTSAGIVYPLLEGILDEINLYGETCLQIDDLHVLNLRLGSPSPPSKPPRVHAWQVPLLIRPLPDPAEWTWDLTMARIHAHLDGVNHVQKIAELADAELKLVKRAVGELILHGRAMLLDIFHFQAIYTTAPAMSLFVVDVELQDECAQYIAKQSNPPLTSELSQESIKDSEMSLPDPTPTLATITNASYPASSTTSGPSRDSLIKLFTSFHQGQTLEEFCSQHSVSLTSIDIRRLVTFGTIKGILTRVHKYALATLAVPTSPLLRKRYPQHNSSDPTGKIAQNTFSNANSASPDGSIMRRGSVGMSKILRFSNEDAVREFDRAWKKAALSSGWRTPPSGPRPSSLGRNSLSAEQVRSEEDERLRLFLDGQHCVDEICAAMHLSERKVLERLRDTRTFGEVLIFHR